MKIGIILSKPPSYSETFFNSKIQGLKAHGHSVKLFVRENNSNFNNCDISVAPKVSKNKCIQAFKSLLVSISLVFYLKRVFKFISLEKRVGRSTTQTLKNIYTNSHILKANLDWVYFGFTTLAIQSEHVAKSINAKMAVSCRGYDMDVYPLKYPNCYNVVWQNVDKVHAISEYMLSQAIVHGMSDITPSQIIYPAVNRSSFENQFANLAPKSQPIKIITIARLHWIKGIDYTLEALSLLKKNNIQFSYQIIGDGDDYEPLRYAVHQLDLEDDVKILGKLTHKETIEHLVDTDIYIQYSISEGFCNAVLEAQAMGCLCIVSDGGALPENIIHNETGWVVPKMQPEALAKQIRDIIKYDESEHIRIKANARNRVLKDFNLKKQNVEFVEFYN